MSRDRLGIVLRLRSLEERRAQAAAARAEHARREAQERVAARVAAYAARPVPEGSLTPVMLRALQLQGTGALEALESAHTYLDTATADRQQAETDRSAAAVRRKSVERLRDRRRDSAARVASAAAQRSLDEIALLMRAES